MIKSEKCKNCHHWKNKQMLLNYYDSKGFCVNPGFNFDISNGRTVGVLDTQNLRDRKKVSGECDHDFESYGRIASLKESRYFLVTSEDFCCNHFTK